MTVGEKIRIMRTSRNMSQKALAEAAGISEISIRKYESGERKPKPEQLEKIAAAFGVGLNIFIDIPLPTLEINTIGDVLSLLLVIGNKVGLDVHYGHREDEDDKTEVLMFSFDNEAVNKAASKWFKEKYDINNNLDALKQAFESNLISTEDYERNLLALQTINQIVTKEYINNKEPLDKKGS